MAGEEPLNLISNGTLKLDRKSIKLGMLTCESSCGTVRWFKVAEVWFTWGMCASSGCTWLVNLYQTDLRSGLECLCCLNEEFDLRLCFVGLSSTGHSVTDTRPGQRVHRLHNDKGPLLQRGHRQMPVVWHRLQVRAVPRPHGVPHLEDPHLIGPRLKESRGWGDVTLSRKKGCTKLQMVDVSQWWEAMLQQRMMETTKKPATMLNTCPQWCYRTPLWFVHLGQVEQGG